MTGAAFQLGLALLGLFISGVTAIPKVYGNERSRVQEIDERLARGVIVRGPVTEQPPRGIVILVTDGETSKPLGSATRICPPKGTPASFASRSLYLTNAHVVDQADGFKTSDGEELRLDLIDSSMDLAMLSSEREGAACLPLAEEFLAYTAYDSEAAANLALTRMDVEAHNLDLGRLQRRTVQSTLVLSINKGMPGREQTGRVLMFNAHGLRGMSGGAVSSRIDSRAFPEKVSKHAGNVNNTTITDHAGKLSQAGPEQLIGLISAVDINGRRMVALAAPVIFQRLEAFFGIGKKDDNPFPRYSRINEKSVPGGTMYLNSGAIHYRNAQRVYAGVGALGSLGSSRTWNLPGKDVKGLTGRKSQSLGTGKVIDGGSGALSETSPGTGQPTFTSGIVQSHQPTKRWLSVADRWSELDPFPTDGHHFLRQLGSPRSHIDGIFEENGELFATGGNARFPQFLSIPESRFQGPNNLYDLTELDQSPFSGLERLFAKGRCRLTRGTVAPDNVPARNGLRVVVCEQGDHGARKTFALAVLPNPYVPAFAFQFKLAKACKLKDDSGRCPLTAVSTLYESIPDDLAPGFPKSAPEPEAFSARLGTIPGSPMKRDGLRYHFNDRYAVEIEQHGGYRISLRYGNGIIRIFGPTGNWIFD